MSFDSVLSSLPSNFKELWGLIQFGTKLDFVDELAKSSTSVSELVFGTTEDVKFDVLAVEGQLYNVQNKNAHDKSVELVFPDRTIQPSVHVDEIGNFTSTRAPEYARVKASARKVAFARLCARTFVNEFATEVQAAAGKIQQGAAVWHEKAYDTFQSIISIAKQRLCKDVMMERETLYRQHINVTVKRNLMVESVLNSGSCAVCKQAAADLYRFKQVIQDCVSPMLDAVQTVRSQFFIERPADVNDDAATAFCPDHLKDKVHDLFHRVLVSNQSRARGCQPPLAGGAFGFSACSPSSNLSLAVNICSATCKTSRVRDTLPSQIDAVVGHWNDAAVTAALCKASGESVLSALVMVVPELDVSIVLQAAIDIDELAKLAYSLDLEFKRRLKDCCVDLRLTFSDLNAEMFAGTSKLVTELDLCMGRVVKSVQRLQEYISGAANFEAILTKTFVQEREALLKQQKCCVSRCPLGNVDYILLGGGRFPEKGYQHSCFGIREGRIYCIDPACVQNRNNGVPVSGDLLKFVHEGGVSDPMQDFLSHKPCSVCENSSKFTLSGDGTTIHCGTCDTGVDCPPTVVEKHDSPQCPDPLRGIQTCMESGMAHCVACGVVVCDYLCIDQGEDDRTFADDEESSSRHGYQSNPFLSAGSDKTYISYAAGSNPSYVKRIANGHRGLNKYVLREDGSRTTTWVKRDAHIEQFQRIIESCDYKLTRASITRATKRFQTLRHDSEKMCSIRLVIFALFAAAMLETRDSLKYVSVCSTCMCCGATMSRRDISKHMRECKIKNKPAKKICTRKDPLDDFLF